MSRRYDGVVDPAIVVRPDACILTDVADPWLYPGPMRSARGRGIAVGAFAVAAAAAIAVGAITVGGSSEASVSRTSLSLIVSPHPDDEMQAWSLVEDTPTQYKVFVFLTRGEQTSFCAADTPGYDAGTGEHRPSPAPEGKWTASCAEARIASTNDFIEQMGATDAGIPSSFSYAGTTAPFPTNGISVTRCDTSCISKRSAEVYDGGAAGIALYFDLGDGDLTTDEVRWAVDTVLQNRGSLGIPDLPWEQVVGASFSNSTHSDCFMYPHPDHRSVNEALWQHDFVGVDDQYGATCADDPAVTVTVDVSDTAFDGAFAMSGATRVGHHVRNYGWLHSSYYAGDYSTSTQNELFHRHQTFWRRF